MEAKFHLALGSGDTAQPGLGGAAAGWGLFVAADDCFLTSLWIRMERKGNAEAQHSGFPLISSSFVSWTCSWAYRGKPVPS